MRFNKNSFELLLISFVFYIRNSLEKQTENYGVLLNWLANLFITVFFVLFDEQKLFFPIEWSCWWWLLWLLYLYLLLLLFLFCYCLLFLFLWNVLLCVLLLLYILWFCCCSFLFFLCYYFITYCVGILRTMVGTRLSSLNC